MFIAYVHICSNIQGAQYTGSLQKKMYLKLGGRERKKKHFPNLSNGKISSEAETPVVAKIPIKLTDHFSRSVIVMFVHTEENW